MTTFIVLATIAAIGLQSIPQGAEAMSLLGKPLYAPTFEAATLAKLEADLEKAQEEYKANPKSVDAAVWVGRRIAYLGRYRESIKFYTEALDRHGRDAKLLRHRGHRYITLRNFDAAIKDFEEAGKLFAGKRDEVEPDGVPNAKNTPISSLHSNIWYHLALAYYLKGDFKKALSASDKGMKVSNNSDRLVSQTYWRYLILRRLGKDDEAKKALEVITPDLELIENREYLDLLLMFKGEALEQDVAAQYSVPYCTLGSFRVRSAAIAFGLAALPLVNGDTVLAKKRLIMATDHEGWASFGVIAAEAELQRMK